ncbi:hypothetical protein H0H92_005411 [Tricholoma furcatifolium]|nr:hypothetical protein H0H92_005411 [Tricholoma furcatifolium]
MDHSPVSESISTQATTEAAHSTSVVPQEDSFNPWSDATNADSPTPDGEKPLHIPDPSLMDQSVLRGFQTAVTLSPTDQKPSQVSQDVLNEFDPLANEEQKAAQKVWETAESHPPPPPRTPSPKPPALPLKDNVPMSPDSPHSGGLPTSPFPSFASFARTFSIPSLTRPRPLSLDQAKPVPSPSTLSSFVAQQEAATPRNDVMSTSKLSPAPTPPRMSSGTSSPVPGSHLQGEIPFDFQSFLDQMKSRSAEPVSKYLRSFLSNFAKRTFTVNDQVKIINDFLNFIAGQMRACEPWKNASDAEFDNAMEGMEKLVMNRLYDFTFTPQVVYAVPARPITADDLERDRVLSQRIALFGWIEEKHLDIPEGEGSAGFLMFAHQELLKINHYKAPRDKLICILNCCKVIYGLIRHLKADESADAFVPILIYVVLKANPEHLLSNVEFINRFRNPEKLQSEAGYYLSSLMGAVSFIETMDHTSLSNITQEEFERNVEEAIQTLPHSEASSPVVSQAPSIRSGTPPSLSSHVGEESAQPLAMSTPTQSISDDAKRLLQKTGDTISKPLNAIGRIFSDALDGAEKLSNMPGPFAPFELGRDQRQQTPAPPPVPRWSHPQNDGRSSSPGAQVPQTPYSAGSEGMNSPPLQTPYKPRVRRAPSSASPAGPGSPGFLPEETPSRLGPYTHQPLAMGPSQNFLSPTLLSPRVQSLAVADGQSVSRTPTPNLDLAGLSRQIDAAHEHAAAAARDTLIQIFPSMDTEVIEWVLEAQNGDLGKSIEALLEMSGGS